MDQIKGQMLCGPPIQIFMGHGLSDPCSAPHVSLMNSAEEFAEIDQSAFEKHPLQIWSIGKGKGRMRKKQLNKMEEHAAKGEKNAKNLLKRVREKEKGNGTHLVINAVTIHLTWVLPRPYAKLNHKRFSRLTTDHCSRPKFQKKAERPKADSRKKNLIPNPIIPISCTSATPPFKLSASWTAPS